ncbi:5621_t:CDS:2 [Entrophospora sp. SA101]|nr:5621_t:CDS:2 [Entrophospora sp. SA101]
MGLFPRTENPGLSITRHKLRKLIESQRSLNYFRYSRTNCPEAFSEEYINSCSTQSKSLKKLVFDSVPLKNNTNNLMKINKLKFLNSHLDGVITTILYLVNCNLSELTLENSTKAHLEVINRHCANLNYLALSTTTNTLISSSILLSTTNLKHLVLNLKNYSTKMTEQDLNQLGKNLPISLNTLHLNSVFVVDERLLGEVLEENKNHTIKFPYFKYEYKGVGRTSE